MTKPNDFILSTDYASEKFNGNIHLSVFISAGSYASGAEVTSSGDVGNAASVLQSTVYNTIDGSYIPGNSLDLQSISPYSAWVTVYSSAVGVGTLRVKFISSATVTSSFTVEAYIYSTLSPWA
jgi:hypothetical protein